MPEFQRSFGEIDRFAEAGQMMGFAASVAVLNNPNLESLRTDAKAADHVAISMKMTLLLSRQRVCQRIWLVSKKEISAREILCLFIIQLTMKKIVSEQPHFVELLHRSMRHLD